MYHNIYLGISILIELPLCPPHSILVLIIISFSLPPRFFYSFFLLPFFRFYCILRGSVTAYVDTESEISCLDTTNATLSAGASNAKVLKQSGNRKRLRGYGLEANVIRPGQCFGEMCCLSVSDVAKSPFTFVTSQYSEILSLNKSAFQSLLQEYFVSCVMERASFLVSHYPMIRSWEMQCLSRLCSVLHERTYSLGEVVATQGSPISSIYFVKEGLLKLSIDPEKINLSEIRSKIRPPTGLLAQILKLETPHKTALVKKPKGVPLQRKERDLQGERESVLRRYRLKQPNLLREMPICVLTNGGIVNGIEALCDLRHQLFTICAESNNLVLYCINTVHFSSLFCSLCPEEMIAHLLDHLLHWRERFPCLQMFECLRLLFEQQLVELERKRLMHDEGISSRCHHHRHALHHPEILPKLVKDFICR